MTTTGWPVDVFFISHTIDSSLRPYITVGYGIYWAFYDIQRLDGQEFIQEVSSPDNTYTITAYLNDGGATTGYSYLSGFLELHDP